FSRSPDISSTSKCVDLLTTVTVHSIGIGLRTTGWCARPRSVFLYPRDQSSTAITCGPGPLPQIALLRSPYRYTPKEGPSCRPRPGRSPHRFRLCHAALAYPLCLPDSGMPAMTGRCHRTRRISGGSGPLRRRSCPFPSDQAGDTGGPIAVAVRGLEIV